jgi:hypothetical protein
MKYKKGDIKKMALARCKNKKCEKKDSCERYLSKEDKAVIAFENICPMDNFKWYVNVETAISKKNKKDG